MEAIKQLGTNGGGFLDANSATSFENPTGFTNWLSILLLLAIPVALTYTFGKMVKERPPRSDPARGDGDHLRSMGRSSPPLRRTPGATRGRSREASTRRPGTPPKAKRSVSTTPSTALFAVASTGTSTLRIWRTLPTTRSHRSEGSGCSPGMMLGEVTPGGTGSGLYTILIYAIIAVYFIGGLMIGRTPEYLGKEDPGSPRSNSRASGPLSCRSRCSSSRRCAVSVHAGRIGPPRTPALTDRQ